MMKRVYIAWIGLLLLILVGCETHPSQSEQIKLRRHPGLEWLSWTPKERETFVKGYIAGDGGGANRACQVTDDLFETDKPHAFGDAGIPSTFPSSRCLARIEEYSVNYDEIKGPDFTPFTSAITEFYTKYQDHRDTPFILLAQYLTGPKHLTADDLYSRLQTSKLPGADR
jgi:hypothetical protein